MQKLKSFIIKVWKPVLTVVLGTCFAIFVLGFRLGSLTRGFSEQELLYLQGTTSLKTILANPMFLPFKLGEYILFKLHMNLPIEIRSISALIGLACVWGFYLLLKRWHTPRVAILGGLMFLCSSWFLAISRSATPTILYVFNVLSILFIGALVHQKKASKISLVLAAICAALLVYSPGMAWLLVLGVAWQFKSIINLLKQNPVWLWVLSSVLFGLLLMPAVYATFKDFHFVLDIFSIPQTLLPLEMAKRIIIVPTQLFVRGPADSYWLGRLPIMDMFTGAMFVVGFYAYYLRFTLGRTQFIVWLSVTLLVLIAILNIPTVVVLPIVYLLVVGGITLLLQQWFTVFPINPLARNVGFGVMTVAVLFSCWFQLNRYFVAWRHSPETMRTYSHQLIR